MKVLTSMPDPAIGFFSSVAFELNSPRQGWLIYRGSI
jgi:hypothetical protein